MSLNKLIFSLSKNEIAGIERLESWPNTNIKIKLNKKMWIEIQNELE